MSIPGSATPLFLASTAAGPGPAAYSIERSLRFNGSDDSSYLNRTPSFAGNRRTWTWSGWVKAPKIASTQQIMFSASTGSTPYTSFDFRDNNLRIIEWNGSSIVFEVKTDAILRDPSAWYHVVLAVDTTQSTAANRVKIYINGSEQTSLATASYPSQNHQLYMNSSVLHYIGENAATSYNGFLNAYLADIHFIDGQALAPTDFGEFDANGVWQPKEYTFGTPPTLSLQFANNTSSTAFDSAATSLTLDVTNYSFSSWSGSDTAGNLGGANVIKVLRDSGGNDVTWSVVSSSATTPYIWTSDNGVNWSSPGTKYSTSGTPIYFTSKYIGWAGGSDAITWTISGIPAQGQNSFHLDFSDNSSDAALGTDSSGNNNDWTVNNITANAPGLATAKQGMDVVTYSGTGATQAIGGLQFQPDFVWIKRRNGANAHALFDVIRGVTKVLESSNTGAEKTNDPPITSFDSNGFTVNGSYSQTNASGGTYVGWCWKAGGTASSNTDGSITSQVSANTTYGFSIVSYTGNGTSGATVGHGLSTAPKFIILKNRDTAANWLCYHEAVGATKYIPLNLTNAATTWGGFLNNTAPSSSVITLGNGTGPNGNTNDIIAYCWSEVAGFSKFGSYTGTGAVGHKITTGFKPAYILFRRTDSISNWRIVDEKRGTSSLNAETAEAEQTLNFAINADGFTINETGNNPNASGGTYIYAAFAGTPAGEDVDSLFDSPTNGTQTDTGLGGQVSGNYATLNPLFQTGTYSNGNLDLTTTAGNKHYRGTIGVSSGKWYWEITPTGGSTPGNAALVNDSAPATQNANQTGGYAYYGVTGNKQTSGVDTSYGATYTYNDVIGVAFDADNGTLTFYKNGTSQGTAFTGLTDGPYYPACSAASSSNTTNFVFNAGQRAFAYTAPSGFKALNTANLSDPTIADGSDYMDVVTYTGNGTSLAVGDPVFSATADSGVVSASQIFNGSTSDGGYYNGTGTDITLTTSPFTINTSLRVYQNFRSDGTYAICLNSSCVNVPGTGTDSTAFRWSTVDLSTFTLPLSVTKLGYSLSQNSGNTIRAIEVDGTILINGAGQPVNFEPDFVWVKNRSTNRNHYVYDAIRGAGTAGDLAPNTTDAEDNLNTGAYGYLSAFTSNGFTVVSGTDSTGNFNSSGQSYVGWTWDAGTSTVSNTDGSITSQVRANPSAGFSIVSWTGNGTNGATVGHGLSGAEDGMIIVKNRDFSGVWWATYHASLTTGKVVALNSTQGEFDETYLTRGIIESVTSSTFSCTAGPAGNETANGSGDSHIAYCFAPVEGYSSFGSYTGNGSTDGPFVYTGFRPKWVLIKITNATDSWLLYDSVRSTYNVIDDFLQPNSSEAEATGNSNALDFLSNGFKLKGSVAGTNGNNNTYLYACFSENPFKYARAR